MLRWDIKKIVVVLVLFSILIAVLNFTDFSKDIKNFFFLLSSPIQRSFWQAGKSISDFTSGIWEIRTLKKEIENLRFKNQELLGQIAALMELRKENETLREALELGLEKEFDKLMLARIVSKDISQDSILINRGERDGVSAGLTVITAQRVLLGKIGAVFDGFSEVILISNKESSFGARIPEREFEEDEFSSLTFANARVVEEDKSSSSPFANARVVDGIIKGKGNFNLSLDLIPREKEIFEGDFVVTSVLGGAYPPGLLVGHLKTIKKSDVDPFQSAEIKPAFDINSLDYLFIVQ